MRKVISVIVLSLTLLGCGTTAHFLVDSDKSFDFSGYKKVYIESDTYLIDERNIDRQVRDYLWDNGYIITPEEYSDITLYLNVDMKSLDYEGYMPLLRTTRHTGDVDITSTGTDYVPYSSSENYTTIYINLTHNGEMVYSGMAIMEASESNKYEYEMIKTLFEMIGKNETIEKKF